MPELDMTGYEKLDLGVSSHIRNVWWNYDSPNAQAGKLRIEFSNRKGEHLEGAVYQYDITCDLKERLEQAANEMGTSFGKFLHKELIGAPHAYPYICVRKAEE